MEAVPRRRRSSSMSCSSLSRAVEVIDNPPREVSNKVCCTNDLTLIISDILQGNKFTLTCNFCSPELQARLLTRHCLQSARVPPEPDDRIRKLRMQKTLERCRALFQIGSIGKVLVSSGAHVSNPYGCNIMTRALLPSSNGIVSNTFDDGCSCHHRHHLHDVAVISLNKNIRAVNVAPPQDLIPGLARTIYRFC